jgi:hypothetical protein
MTEARRSIMKTSSKSKRWMWLVVSALVAGMAIAPSDGGCSYCTDNPDNCA